jgi:hypothetical protein
MAREPKKALWLLKNQAILDELALWGLKFQWILNSLL